MRLAEEKEEEQIQGHIIMIKERLEYEQGTRYDSKVTFDQSILTLEGNMTLDRIHNQYAISLQVRLYNWMNK